MEYEYEMVSYNRNGRDIESEATDRLQSRVDAGWLLHSHSVLRGDGELLEHHYIWQKAVG